ncbi:ThiF family adenylyltransferase, partial [Candidatus Gottesmanbacteria bacterium]|nr:ThiF family adenylyltransferase [Candidatus Gottesmanbacteria bacterium]
QLYDAATTEIGELAQGLPDSSLQEQLLVDQMISELRKVSAVAQVLDAYDSPIVVSTFTPLARDLKTLSLRVHEHARDMRDDIRLFHDKKTKKIEAYVGPEIHWTLSASRCLGLIPLDTLEKMRRMHISVIGASVAASSLDMLASLGVGTDGWIRMIDDGILAPSNIPRMPGATLRDVGRLKVEFVHAFMKGRQPYAPYIGYRGRAVQSEGEKRQGFHDMELLEFIHGSDVVIEVVDSPHVKAGVQILMVRHMPQTSILRPADVGSAPFVAVEIPAGGDLFNAGMTQDEILQLSSQSTSLRGSMAKVHRMVRSNFPVDHELQFIVAGIGMIPFWSQLPSSARESGAMVAKVISRLAEGDRSVLGRNITLADAPHLGYGYTHRQAMLIRDIGRALFSIPS